MELGYNTDITLDNGTYHVQTEGRLDTNPRVDTLVYKNGVVLSRVSNPDVELGKDDLRIEETKRKIRDQHLSVVALVRRNEIDKVTAVKPARSAFEFLELVPSTVSAEWRDILVGRQEVVFEEWKRGLADAAGLVTPNARSRELRAILAAFAVCLADDASPIGIKQSLRWYLLRLDSRFKVLDVYEAFRRERGDVREYFDLIAALKKSTDRLVDQLIIQSSGESALATELLIELFTRQSMEMVKYLFEEAEKKLTGADAENREVLPTVLLYLEEKVGSENLPGRDLDDIFDRLNYLYARLSVKTVREISSRIAKIRDERGVRTRLRPDQKKLVTEYIDYLDECKEVIEKTVDLESKLERVNEFKAQMDAWDKVLRLYVNLRLALKGYHNFVTVNILETAEVVCMKLKKIVNTLPQDMYHEATGILMDLEGSLQANMNVRKIVIPAIKAQALLASVSGAPAAPPEPGEVDAEIEAVVDDEDGGEAIEVEAEIVADEDEEAPPLEAGPGAMTPKEPEVELDSMDLEPGATPAPMAPTEELSSSSVLQGHGGEAETVAMPVAVPVASTTHVRAVEERIKVWSLALLKAMEELGRANVELARLESLDELPDTARMRLQACRRELVAKKKVLQQRLSSL